MISIERAALAAEAFKIRGAKLQVEVHPRGLIHDTFVVSVETPEGSQQRFILQRINQRVFERPAALMENVERVILHLQGKSYPQHLRWRFPELVPALDGTCWVESEGQAWRMFRFVENATSIDTVASCDQAVQIGRAFGRFLDAMADFPSGCLHDVLPAYRNTQKYLDALWHARDEDAWNRAKSAQSELAFIESHVQGAVALQALRKSRQMSLRAIHGDTKPNNALLDDRTGNPICVIDLDTVRPGLIIEDMGDCVRDCLSTRPSQDCRYLTSDDLCLIEAIVAGFLAELEAAVDRRELDNLVMVVESMALELGARFLADFLKGDVYFKTDHPDGNLDRARQQFRLAQRLASSKQETQQTVTRIAARRGRD